MRINTNSSAINTYRQLGDTEKKLSESTRKLSSGLKIGISADDSAGLAISEGMRAQIRGLNMGSKNAQDAISFIQTADGAMNDIHALLKRARELCIQSASDVYADIDRYAIQEEIYQIVNEIHHITDTTTFNTMYVFKEGSLDDHDFLNNYGLGKILGEKSVAQVNKLTEAYVFPSLNAAGWTTSGTSPIAAAAASIASDLGITGAGNINTVTGYNPVSSTPSGSNTVVTGIVNNGGTYDGQYVNLTYNAAGDLTSARVYDNSTGTTSKNYSYSQGGTGSSGVGGNTYAGAWLDFSGLGTDYNVSELYNQGFNSTCATCNNHYSIRFVDASNDPAFPAAGYRYTSGSSHVLEVRADDITSGDALVSRLMDAVTNTNGFTNHFTQYAVNSSDPSKLYIYDNRTSTYPNGGTSTFELSVRNNAGEIISPEVTETLWIQTRSNPSDGVLMEKPMLNTMMMGISGLSVLGHDSAASGIGVVDSASALVSTKQARLGALQNRLEFSIALNDIFSENLQSAESRIRDTDTVKEVTSLARSQILNQSGTTMLAQANTMSQNVLQLIK